MRGDGCRLLQKARGGMMPHHHSLLSSSSAAAAAISAGTMSMNTSAAVPGDVYEQKRALRSQIRRALKAFPPAKRAQEDVAIQDFVLGSSWFKSTERLCAYISCEALREVDTMRILSEILRNPDADHDAQVKKTLYLPRVEDKNSYMRMFNVTSIEDLVANSMNILEPSTTDADGNQREDVMMASHPVDIFLLPGVAFDKHGRRLGRGGGYYDVFLKKYKELAIEQKWEQPLMVALAYSVQILEDDVIPITSKDITIDALVSPSGVIPISPAAMERM